MTTEKKPIPAFLKFLMMVSGTFLLVVIAVALMSAAAVGWAVLPGTQVDTRHAIGEDSVAVVHVTDLGDDPEVSALMGALFQGLLDASIKQDPSAQKIPALQKRLLEKQMTFFMRFTLPHQLTLVADPNPDDEGKPTVGMVANMRMGVRPVKQMVSMDAEQSGRVVHEDNRDFFFQSNDDVYISFDGGTLVGSRLLSNARQLHRRIDARTDAPLARDVTELSEEWPVVAVTRDKSVLLATVPIPTAAEHVMDEQGTDDDTSENGKQTVSVTFARAWMGARISDADTAELRVAIEKPAQSAVEPLSAALDAFCKKLQSDMAGGKVVFSCTHALVGDTLTLDARATNLRAAATASMEKDMRKARQPTSSTGPVVVPTP